MKTILPSRKNSAPVRRGSRAVDFLHDPYMNKGTAFTEPERKRLGLLGLLPPQVCTIEQQCERVLENFRRVPDGRGKSIMLSALQARNQPLFYGGVTDKIEEPMPSSTPPWSGRPAR